MRLTTGQCMRFYRRKAQLSLKDVEIELDVSTRVIGCWERDESIPDIYSFRTMANLYGVKMEELFGDIQPEPVIDDRYLGYKEVAKEIGISNSSVWKWYKESKGAIRFKFIKEKGAILYNVGDFKNYFYFKIKRG